MGMIDGDLLIKSIEARAEQISDEISNYGMWSDEWCALAQEVISLRGQWRHLHNLLEACNKAE